MMRMHDAGGGLRPQEMGVDGDARAKSARCRLQEERARLRSVAARVRTARIRRPRLPIDAGLRVFARFAFAGADVTALVRGPIALLP